MTTPVTDTTPSLEITALSQDGSVLMTKQSVTSIANGELALPDDTVSVRVVNTDQGNYASVAPKSKLLLDLANDTEDFSRYIPQSALIQTKEQTIEISDGISELVANDDIVMPNIKFVRPDGVTDDNYYITSFKLSQESTGWQADLMDLYSDRVTFRRLWTLDYGYGEDSSLGMVHAPRAYSQTYTDASGIEHKLNTSENILFSISGCWGGALYGVAPKELNGATVVLQPSQYLPTKVSRTTRLAIPRPDSPVMDFVESTADVLVPPEEVSLTLPSSQYRNILIVRSPKLKYGLEVENSMAKKYTGEYSDAYEGYVYELYNELGKDTIFIRQPEGSDDIYGAVIDAKLKTVGSSDTTSGAVMRDLSPYWVGIDSSDLPYTITSTTVTTEKTGGVFHAVADLRGAVDFIGYKVLPNIRLVGNISGASYNFTSLKVSDGEKTLDLYKTPTDTLTNGHLLNTIACNAFKLSDTATQYTLSYTGLVDSQQFEGSVTLNVTELNPYGFFGEGVPVTYDLDVINDTFIREV